MEPTEETQQKPVNPRGGRSFLGIGLALLLAVAAFFSGAHFGSGQNDGLALEANLFSLFASTPVQPDAVEMTEFWRVWELMEEKFVAASSSATFSVEDRLRGAIDGLVDSYADPYTVYLPPQEATQFEEEISGNFGGVGMEVGMRDGLVTVIAPLPDTPAEAAGLLPGDTVVEIDDVSTENMSIDQAVQRIRGEIGTEVVLTIFRAGASDFMEVSIIRDTISIPTLDTEVRDGVFIISLYNFNALAEMKMQEALREYTESGLDKLVLDLRGNPGGFLQSAVSIASYFLPTGKVVVREGFEDSEELYRSSGKSLGAAHPEEMIILINGGSASASEILAGALSEHGVATLMGNTTFGKGSVQELVDLPDGASLKVTIARWFTPNGVSISAGGLEPDIYVARTIADFEAELDPQLDAAVAWLNGDKTVGSTTKPVAE